MKKEGPSFWFKLFIGFHVLAVIVWTLPPPVNGAGGPTPQTGLDVVYDWNARYLKTSPARLYLQTTGQWQAWDMFSRNPSNRNVWGSVEIEYKDGVLIEYEYPRMAKLGKPERYIRERYRKYFERINLEEFGFMWPFFAQGMAERHAGNDPNNPPVRVWIVRHLKITPPTIGAGDYFGRLFADIQAGRATRDSWLPPNPEGPENWEVTRLYEHIVDQEELFRDKGWKLP